MTTTIPLWIDQILDKNIQFRARIDRHKLPVERTPGAAVITCMDPRVNLESIGIPAFSQDGTGTSPVRIIRTLGAIAEDRSLIVGIYLAGFREIVILMHTDCGCCLAYSKIDTIVANLRARLSPEAFQAFQAEVGEPFTDKLRVYLKAFENPYDAVQAEVERIHQMAFIPDDLIVHGLVYDLSSGKVDVVVNGSE